MFKRIAAAVAKVEMTTGGYNMANVSSNAVNNNSLGNIFGSVLLAEEGIVSTEIGVPSNKIKIANGALYCSTDGGVTYQKIVGSEGINPELLVGGLNLNNIIIGSKDKPELSLTNSGLTAF
jgi:hypothetical protein